VEERKALRKAEARKEHAELKCARWKKWVAMLDREVENQIGPVNNLRGTRQRIPSGIAQLTCSPKSSKTISDSRHRIPEPSDASVSSANFSCEANPPCHTV